MENCPPSTEFQNGQVIKRTTGFQQVKEMVKAVLHKGKVYLLQFQTRKSILMERRSESELHRESPVRNERHEAQHVIAESQNLIHSKEMREKQLPRTHLREKMWMDNIPAQLDPSGCTNIGNKIYAIGEHLLEAVDRYRKQADEKNQRVLEVEEKIRKLSQQNEALTLKLRDIECRRTPQLNQNLVFSSYSDEFANPVSLDQALEAAQDAITKFSNQWFDCLISKSSTSAEDCHLYTQYYFARMKHMCYAVKADVNKGLFKYFEGADFGQGFNGYLDPELRQAKCLEYIHHSKLGSTEQVDTDDQFQKFFTKRQHYLGKLYRQHQNAVDRSRLESFLDQIQTLMPDFKAAARRVWLLHKLAYAFEPPARILRVAGDAEYDQLFMKPVVTFADDDSFIPKVGFMIAPGFYLNKTTIKAEIYLAGIANKKSP